MTKQSSAFTVLAALSAGAALAAVGSFTMSGSTETMLRSSFETALRDSHTRAPDAVQVSKAPVSGSEEFWLRAQPFDGAPISKTVSVGDRIAMNLGGHDRQFEVASVSEFKPSTTEIDTRDTSVRLVLVTARDTGDVSARPIRFVMELETAGTPGKPVAQAKSL